MKPLELWLFGQSHDAQDGGDGAWPDSKNRSGEQDAY
jgi:hypothetical protein